MAEKKLGLALSSGAARGWAHIGALRALQEIGAKPSVIAGCSVGALVGGAYLLDAMEAFESWARSLQPFSALEHFSFKVTRGGFINAEPAFDAFRQYDRNIEDLPTAYGAVAVDLGTGEEITITTGSVIEAARASSAIPVALHAVERAGRWLVDGALANPAPISLARALGADVVICVDLNAVPKVLDRFEKRPAQLPALVEPKDAPRPGVSGAVARLIEDTQAEIQRQVALAKARANASPHLFETAYAAADIFQMQLARARTELEPPDILIRPDMRDALPTAFDRADEFIEEGRRALLARRQEIETLLSD
ncbi:MAG: patatin-like phospholipase family protein [Pseudomonadota bacterium]